MAGVGAPFLTGFLTGADGFAGAVAGWGAGFGAAAGAALAGSGFGCPGAFGAAARVSVIVKHAWHAPLGQEPQFFDVGDGGHGSGWV